MKSPTKKSIIDELLIFGFSAKSIADMTGFKIQTIERCSYLMRLKANFKKQKKSGVKYSPLNKSEMFSTEEMDYGNNGRDKVYDYNKFSKSEKSLTHKYNHRKLRKGYIK